MKSRLVTLLLAVAVPGCSTIPTSTIPISQRSGDPVPAARIYQPELTVPSPGHTATVSFLRDAGFLGGGCTHKILVRGKPAFAIRAGEHQTLYLAPGRYLFALEIEGGICPQYSTSYQTVLNDGAEETYRILIQTSGRLGEALYPRLEKIAATPGRVSPQADRAPEDSLCDLGPNTTGILGRKIPGPTLAEGAPFNQWSEIYVRLAARFVASSCSNGQILVLHSENTRPLDVAYLPFLASALCLKEDITDTKVLSKSGTTGEQQRGFELRCKITKLEKVKADLEQLEKRESTESLIARLQAQARKGRPSESKP